HRTPIDTLADLYAIRPGLPPSGFVFHMSRCGSTLIAQMLATLPSHAVYAEAMPIDQLLRARYHDAGLSEAAQFDGLRALVTALGRPRRTSETRLVLKLDAWSIAEAHLLRTAYPRVPAIFLYRDPIEIVVSHLRQPGVHTVPGVNGPSPLWDDLPATLPRVEYIARVIGRILRAGLAECASGAMRPVNYTELPGVVLGELAPLLGVDAAQVEQMRAASTRNAKHPQQAFAADGADKRAEADAAVRDAVARWAAQPYAALEAMRSEARLSR
ncbi:MAG TPA: sulfotransferase family protein, partial [Chitinolyticbacter sp.]|nr:sulfotransferase family protein [Chitinolyticbacter sp.]